MNDQSRSNDQSSVVPTMVGFALGALVGAGLALLLAPTTGVELRSRIASKARDLGLDARDKLDQARDKVAGLASSTRSAIETGREAFLSEGSRREPRPSTTPGLQGQSIHAPSTPA